MDKSWMQIKNKLHPDYEEGVEKFIEFAYTNKDINTSIPCPCVKCNNFLDQNRRTMKRHLFIHGIVKSYVRWVHHGEGFWLDSNEPSVDAHMDEDSGNDNLHGLVDDIGTSMFGENWTEENLNHIDTEENENHHGQVNMLFDLLKDAKSFLYPDCEVSKLAFIVNLLHLKTMNRWSCKSIDSLLQFLKTTYPKNALIPGSYYEAKKYIRELGLLYEKIHVCRKDCILYRKEYASLGACPFCNTPRYRSGSSKIPQKVFRYFPLTPRLQRLFVNHDIACDMRWHKEKRLDDGKSMRHPADSQCWKEFDHRYPSFAEDARNIRLGLACDGFNPFGSMSNSYSVWPVIVVPYNLPPWKCMKDPFFFLTMVTTGPNAPGVDIDIFLEPLIDELKNLWDNGVQTYDSYGKETFQLRAALLWTINDYPAYGDLSGWSNKGYGACPTCMEETSCVYLKKSKKCCYLGHRRFLPKDHKWRRERKAFDGKQELRDMINPLPGEDILSQQSNLFEKNLFGKSHETLKKRKRIQSQSKSNWRKKSIFFELPYWKTLKLRHNLDVMHITKNVFDSVIGTLMDIEGKTKDTPQGREDLKEMSLRPELHLLENGHRPAACYNLSAEEKKKVCNFLSTIKYPDNFASNISRCVKDSKFQISGLKSHDCYIFMQRILPLVLRCTSLNKDVCLALVELSDFFRKLCSRTLNLDELEKLEKNIPLIICKLERIFPPSFFDIMVHLLIHLATEAKIAGPVQFRWMFPFERKMGKYKSFVDNKARPEGCIAERYLVDECLTFCSMYLKNTETKFNREERNSDMSMSSSPIRFSVFSFNGRPFGGVIFDVLSNADLEAMHMYILQNCEEIDDYREEFQKEVYKVKNPKHNVENQFPAWFRKRVVNERQCNEDLVSLATGPDNRVAKYNGCNNKGYRFHTRHREKNRTTQNSGVVVKGDHNGEFINFYGVLTDIFVLDYPLGKNQVILFMCDWWNVGDNAGIRVDKVWQMTSVNTSRTWYHDQPYVLASQVEQVFYLEDQKLGNNWFIVEKVQPRGSYDVLEKNDESLEDEPYQEEELGEVFTVIDTEEIISLERHNLDPLQCVEGVLDMDRSEENKFDSDDDIVVNDVDDVEDENVEEGDDSE